MSMGTNQLIPGIFDQRMPLLHGSQIKIPRFQPYFLAILLIIAFAADDIIQPGKIDTDIGIRPIGVSEALRSTPSILNNHSEIIIQQDLRFVNGPSEILKNISQIDMFMVFADIYFPPIFLYNKSS